MPVRPTWEFWTSVGAKPMVYVDDVERGTEPLDMTATSGVTLSVSWSGSSIRFNTLSDVQDAKEALAWIEANWV